MMADNLDLEEHERRHKAHDEFLAVYDDARAELMRIPGVVEVSTAAREQGGKLTRELVFRVWVKEKLAPDAVPAGQEIPKTVKGFPTDVVQERESIPIIGFSDENDTKNYKIKAGGVRIGMDTAGTGQGTLCCFVKLNSDGSTQILSCFHVLRQREFFNSAAAGTDIGVKVGQPEYEESCCCTCNEIAVVGAGDKNLDCAIAKASSDLKFAPKIHQILKPDGTVELTGLISGSGTAAPLDEVWKVGARTGLTRGTLSTATPKMEIHPLAAFPYVADHGDSGSAVVGLATGNVVGLLNSIDKEIAAGGTLGIATPIGPILALLGISVLASDPTQQYGVRDWGEDWNTATEPRVPEDVFAAVADRLDRTERGREMLALIRRRRPEIVELVNHRRPVTVAWRRNLGPSYLAALLRTAREPTYKLPESLDGVTRKDLADRMAEVLAKNGSQDLRADLARWGGLVEEAWLSCSTLDEALDMLERRFDLTEALIAAE
jgi:hypothetical protein